jgi:molecular chaperone GrpE
MSDETRELKTGAPSELEPAGALTPGDQPESGGEPAADRARDLEAERDRYYDLLLRKTAEFDNYRKRTERERREQAEQAAAGLLAELLPVVDDLERALATDAGSDQGAAYRQGVELILRQMLELLKRRGVRPIDALGQDFDPRFHQAVAVDESPGHRDGEVVEELRRGYLLGEKLLRPAMVKVARA